MPIPLIPLVFGAASLAAGALGLKKGFDAKKTLEEAKSIGQIAYGRYEKVIRKIDEQREVVNLELEELAQQKKVIFLEILGYVVNQVKNAKSSASGIEEKIHSIEKQEIQDFDRDLTKIAALDIGAGAASGITSGVAGAFGAYGSVGLLASASTGTAISSLSGVAATNATLAWLGGGSLAAGGLGIAGGTWVLGGLVAGPALAITGYALASKAEEALTKAEEYKATVDKAIEELKAANYLLNGIQSNIHDTKYVLNELRARFEKIKLSHEKHMLNYQGWRLLYQKFRGEKYKNNIDTITEIKLQELIGFGKTIKLIVNEPIIDKVGAPASGFNARITGYIEVENNDLTTKNCIHCRTKISSFTRVCPECATNQEMPAPENLKTRKSIAKDILWFSIIAFLIFGWKDIKKSPAYRQIQEVLTSEIINLKSKSPNVK